jgi:beta-mannosidase
VEVRADALLRDLALLADVRLPDAIVDCQVMTVLPGETVTFAVRGRGTGALAPEDWADLLYSEARVR